MMKYKYAMLVAFLSYQGHPDFKHKELWTFENEDAH